MKNRTIFFSLIVLLSFVLTACGGAVTPQAMVSHDTATPDAMMAHETATPDTMMSHETPTPDTMMSHETPTPDAMMSHGTVTPDAMMKPPAWFDISFTDARTGQNFTINSFKGKVVLVETMAVWCSSCYAQQEQIKAYHDLLGKNTDLVSLSLDIDPNEKADTLKSYVNKTSFDWLYAVSSTDVSRGIAQAYGDQFLNPPSTPILIIDRHGVAHPLPFGIKSAQDLMKAIQPYLDEKM